MKLRNAFFVALLIAPALPLACSSGDDTSDAGGDGGKDVTTPDVHADTTLDAPKDTQLDTKTDNETVDASGDADSSVTDSSVTDSSVDDSSVDADSSVDDSSTTEAGPDAFVSDGSAPDASDASDASDGGTFVAPVCDGVIGTTEYGGSAYQTASGLSTWYMTWDSTYLYIGLDGAAVTEAAIIYVGFSGLGLSTAQVYDSTGGTLPFAADGVAYAHSTYQETRTAATTWSGPTTTSVKFCGSGTTRELVIAWSSFGATSIPAQFDFLAYATSGTGFGYAQIPTTNPVGSFGTSATFSNYYQADTTGTPFSTLK